MPSFIKLHLKGWLWTWFTLAFLLGSQAFAATIQLSKQQLDSLLRESFPMQYETDDYQVTLSDPEPVFGNGKDRLDLDVRVSVQDSSGKQVFHGRGIAQGTLRVDTHLRQLQLVRSRLGNLAAEPDSAESEPADEGIRQQLESQRISRIVLADLYSFTPRLPLQSMISVRVWNDAVVIEY